MSTGMRMLEASGLLMDHGIAVLGGEDAPGTERLRYTRGFYALVEREMPRLIEEFKRTHPMAERKGDG